MSDSSTYFIKCDVCLGGETGCLAGISCGHVFHLACLSKWAEKSETCPRCRKKFTWAPGTGGKLQAARIFDIREDTTEYADLEGQSEGDIQSLYRELERRNKALTQDYEDKIEHLEGQNRSLDDEAKETFNRLESVKRQHRTTQLELEKAKLKLHDQAKSQRQFTQLYNELEEAKQECKTLRKLLKLQNEDDWDLDLPPKERAETLFLQTQQQSIKKLKAELRKAREQKDRRPVEDRMRLIELRELRLKYEQATTEVEHWKKECDSHIRKRKRDMEHAESAGKMEDLEPETPLRVLKRKKPSLLARKLQSLHNNNKKKKKSTAKMLYG